MEISEIRVESSQFLDILSMSFLSCTLNFLYGLNDWVLLLEFLQMRHVASHYI